MWMLVLIWGWERVKSLEQSPAEQVSEEGQEAGCAGLSPLLFSSSCRGLGFAASSSVSHGCVYA